MKNKAHPAWRMLVAGCLMVGGGQGFMTNVFGMFMTPISAAQGISVALLGTAISIGSLAMMVVMAFVGKIMQRIPLKPLLFIAVIMQCGAYMLMGQLRGIIGFYIVYPLFAISGAIPCFIIGPMLITNWFVAKRGMMMGIMMCCGNIGAIIASLLGGTIIQRFGYQYAFIALGAIPLVMMIVATTMIVPYPSLVGATAYGAAQEQENSEDDTPSSGTEAEESGISSAGALKSLAFYSVFAIVLLLICGATFSIYISPLGSSLGLSAAAAGSLISVYQIGALAGSFLIGVLNDKIGIRSCCILCFALLSASALCMALFGGNIFILYAVLVVYGFSTSAGGVQPAMLTGKLFGQKEYPAIFGRVQIGQSLAGLIAPTLYGFMFEATGGYTASLLVVVGIGIVNIALVFIAFRSAQSLWKKELGVSMP